MTDEEAQFLCDECHSLFEFRAEAEMFCIKLTDISSHYFTLEIQPDFDNATRWTGRILTCKKDWRVTMRMNNHDDRVQEKYRRALMNYHSHIKPLLESMAHLVTLYKMPQWIVKADAFDRVDNHNPSTMLPVDALVKVEYVWTNKDAEALYRVYESYLAEIRQQYFPYEEQNPS